MKKTEKDYASFAKLMNEEKVYLDRTLTFEGICSRIGAEPEALESLIREELGYSGQESLDLYRSKAENS